MVLVSYFTPKMDDKQLNGLTYATTVAADKKKSRASWNLKDVILSLVVVAIIACILIYFSPIGIGG
jgi:SSS family solute:Na+ symporter